MFGHFSTLWNKGLIHITIIILRHSLYLVYFCSCLGLGTFMSCLCDLLFIFSLIFIVINHITSLRQTHLFFVHFLEYLLLLLDDNRDEESEKFSNKESSASGYCLAFAYFFFQFQPGVAYKKVAYKKKRVFEWWKSQESILISKYSEAVRCSQNGRSEKSYKFLEEKPEAVAQRCSVKRCP